MPVPPKPKDRQSMPSSRVASTVDQPRRMLPPVSFTKENATRPRLAPALARMPIHGRGQARGAGNSPGH